MYSTTCKETELVDKGISAYLRRLSRFPELKAAEKKYLQILAFLYGRGMIKVLVL
jgi:hypothetical protein